LLLIQASTYPIPLTTYYLLLTTNFIYMATQHEMSLRIRELADKLEEGLPREEMMREFTGKWSVSERTIARYMIFANDILSHRLNEREAVLDVMRSEALAEDIENTLRSTLELEARLCAIAEGNLETERTVHTRQGVVKVMQKPTYSEILRAIDRLLKMRGCYSIKTKNLLSPQPMIKLVISEELNEKLKLIAAKNMTENDKK